VYHRGFTVSIPSVRLRLKCDGTRAETRFLLSAKRSSPLKSAGRQFSRLLASEVCTSAVVMLDTPCSEVVWRVLATYSIRQFPLHFFRASPCAIMFQLDSSSTRSLFSRLPPRVLYISSSQIYSLDLHEINCNSVNVQHIYVRNYLVASKISWNYLV